MITILAEVDILLRPSASDFAKMFSLLASSDFQKTYEVEDESASTK